MKTLTKATLIAVGLAALTACDSQTPTTSGESPDATEAALSAPETPGQPADEMVTKPDQGVDVMLPDVPVTTQPAAPAPDAAKPATGQ